MIPPAKHGPSEVTILYAYSVPQWVLFFLIYCFAGWCIESAFVSWRQRRFVNRGFLNGPVIPIYGSGAIAILFATLPVRRWVPAVFLLGMLAATVLEYVTGAAMEAIFKVRYWDYSKNPLNLHGYICLGTSLAWGVLSVILIYGLHAPVERAVLACPETLAQILALVLSGLFLSDLAVSLKTALDLRQLLEQLQAYSERGREEARLLQKRLEVYAAFKKEELSSYLLQKLPDGGEALQQRMEALEQLAERLGQSEAAQKLRTDFAVWKARRAEARESLRQRLTRDKRRMLRGNPTAGSRRYAEQLRLLRQKAGEERRKNRKN